MQQSRLSPLLVLLFCLSGASALAYQVLWTRQLTFVLGGSALAVSTVLAVFMGGLGLGGWLGGRLADRLSRPLLGYAVAEALIAACAILTPILLSTSGVIYLGLHRALHDYPGLVTFSRVLASSIVLLVPTTLMGATLPFVVRFHVRSFWHLGSGLGLLYGINILGGVLGAAVIGYFAIHAYGVRSSLYAAVAVNLAAAGLAWLVSCLSPGRGRIQLEPSSPPSVGLPTDAPPAAQGVSRTGRTDRTVVEPVPSRAAAWVLAGFVLSGFTGLAYEVLWTRALNFAIGNSVYAFTTVLVVTLAGLFAGSILAAAVADRLQRPLLLVGIAQVAGAAGMLLTFSQAGRLPHLTFRLVEKMGSGTPFTDAMTKIIPSSVALLVPMTLLGLSFPLLLKAAAPRMEGLGRRLGHGYATNTVGAILGSAAAGYVLLPALGMTRGMLLVAVLNFLLGAGLLYVSGPRWTSRLAGPVAAGAAIAALAGAFLVQPRPFIANVQTAMKPGAEILSWEEGRTASVSVIRRVDRTGGEAGRDLYINLLGAAVTGRDRVHEQYYATLSLLPTVLHTSPRRVFVAGVASGVTTGAAGLDERTTRVVSVEISPEVIRAARLFDEYNYGATRKHPRITLVADDARAWLATTDERFDILVTDCFLSAVTGTAALYSREYFDLCRRRLAPGGLMSIGVGRLTGTDRTVARTFCEAFPHVALFVIRKPVYNRAFLIGANEPFAFRREAIDAAFSQPLLAAELGAFLLSTPDDVVQAYVCGREDLLPFVQDVPPCTDDHPVIDFQAVAWAEGFALAKSSDENPQQLGVMALRRALSGGRPFPSTP